MVEAQGLSKQDKLIELLARPEGVTISQAMQATGWQAHTIRGTISAVLRRKLGYEVATGRDASGDTVYSINSFQAERVRQRLNARLDTAHNRSSAQRKYTATQVLEAAHVPITTNSGAEVVSENYTVANALVDYMAHYSKEGKGVDVANNIIQSRILPKLGDIKVRELTTKVISNWHYELSREPARLRTKSGLLNKNVRPLDLNDADALRRRKLTANRILTVLKASLNYVWREGYVDSDLAWRRVKPFRSVNSPVIRYLTPDECQRLVQACDPDLRLIVQAALFTGCRYGEICRLVAADYKADTGTIHVKITKNGHPRHVVLTGEGRQFFEGITKGKTAYDYMFKTKNGDPWGKSLQSRRMREACMKAGIEPAITYHILRHTYGSLLAMQGVPMTVVAKQLGHSNTQVTEKHYAHISPGYVAQTVRDNFPILGIS